MGKTKINYENYVKFSIYAARQAKKQTSQLNPDVEKTGTNRTHINGKSQSDKRNEFFNNNSTNFQKITNIRIMQVKKVNKSNINIKEIGNLIY